ncbi:hypothetical protein GGI64_002655 [Rhizobium leguminosarum]|uniref:Uncharacterized protein n=1 Tax=Rhizobium leguminosarum TaxID=384 RepID=A0A7Z0DYB7_RHILE|nr:hypothetical protein [Rhizobium leguminosarum]
MAKCKRFFARKQDQLHPCRVPFREEIFMNAAPAADQSLRKIRLAPQPVMRASRTDAQP